MRTGRIAAACIAFAIPLASHAPVPGASLPKLAGLTTVSGSATASTLVRLDDASAIPVDDLHDHVAVDGRGRAYGIVLSGAERRTRNAFVSVINFAFCGRACTAERDGAGYGFFNSDTEAELIELPAGLYQLTLIADGSETEASLSLPGLRGASTIRPRNGTSGPSREQVVVSSQDSRVAYSGGTTFRVRDRVFSASALRLKRVVAAGGAHGACTYSGGVPDDVAFAPGCPGGTNGLFLDAVIGPFPTTFVIASATVFEEPGRAGHGNWFMGVGIEDADAISIQVPLDF